MLRHLRPTLVVFLFFASVPLAAFPVLLAGLAAKQDPTRPAASAPSSETGLDLSAMNRAIDPCTDFFQFACGAWLAENPLPPDRPRWGRFDELQERNYEILRRVLETAASSGEAATKKIGDYYAACMNEALIERRGATPLEEDLRAIRALGRVADLAGLLAGLHRIGVTAFFTFGAEADFRDAKTVIAIADQGGLGLPDRDYYFRDDARSVTIRARYVEHVATLTGLLGATGLPQAAAAQTVMRVETALAKGALDNVSRRDPARVYHRMTPDELQALTPSFDWPAYFRRVGAPPFKAINVTEPDFFKAFGELLTATSLDDIKTYLRWQLIRADAPILSSAFVNENFRFYGETLRGTTELPPRWRRCVQYTDSHLGESLGQAFVKETFGPSQKADMLEKVRDLESALERDIATLPWMTEATKKQALTKLHAISNKIGYPDRWRDYGAVRIVRGDAVGNAHRANAFEFRRQVNKIGTPVDKAEWSMTPPTVNAYYHPLENNINFPAGILRPPFYRRLGRCRGQFRRCRRRDRPRADPRLRRPGPPVRRARQLERLVDGRRREGLRGARRLLRGSIRRLYRGRRRPSEREADARRKHGGQWRAANRSDGLPCVGCVEERDARRVHAGTARVSRVGADLVREPPPGVRTPAGADQPALARPLSRERSGVEHAGVPEGVLVQAGCAHGARQPVPRMVTGN